MSLEDQWARHCCPCRGCTAGRQQRQRVHTAGPASPSVGIETLDGPTSDRVVKPAAPRPSPGTYPAWRACPHQLKELTLSRCAQDARKQILSRPAVSVLGSVAYVVAVRLWRTYWRTHGVEVHFGCGTRRRHRLAHGRHGCWLDRGLPPKLQASGVNSGFKSLAQRASSLKTSQLGAPAARTPRKGRRRALRWRHTPYARCVAPQTIQTTLRISLASQMEPDSALRIDNVMQATSRTACNREKYRVNDSERSVLQAAV